MGRGQPKNSCVVCLKPNSAIQKFCLDCRIEMRKCNSYLSEREKILKVREKRHIVIKPTLPSEQLKERYVQLSELKTPFQCIDCRWASPERTFCLFPRCIKYTDSSYISISDLPNALKHPILIIEELSDRGTGELA